MCVVEAPLFCCLSVDKIDYDAIDPLCMHAYQEAISEARLPPSIDLSIYDHSSLSLTTYSML